MECYVAKLLIPIFSFQLVFDNYTVNPHSSNVLPASSIPRRTSSNNLNEDSSNADPGEDLYELRQQLQSMKKQALVIMEQSRRSSEKEKIALQQAQEALTLKEAAVTEAVQATSREDYMLRLMTGASLDMAGVSRIFELFYLILFSVVTKIFAE
jgi:hypothetical protein